MFEKYSEKARQSVFFARYEASQCGSTEIETEHLLLGILRADGELARRLLGSTAKMEAIQEQIHKQVPETKRKASTSVDLPVSRGCKRVLGYAAEESKQFEHKHIGPEHLLVGISRHEQCLAARTLREIGLTTERLRQEAVRQAPRGEERIVPPEDCRDLTAAAANGELIPLIGREHELERTFQILSRRTKNNPVLIGEPGVGKTAIVEGLAQRIAEVASPAGLAERRVLAVDAGSLLGPKRRVRSADVEGVLEKIARDSRVILCIEGLFDLTAAGSVWAAVEASHVLEPQLARGGIQCIATGTPWGLRHTIEKAGNLARHFEVVAVAPATEAEALLILLGLKGQYERFHKVTFGEGTIEAAIHASGRFLMHRYLPDRAIDLIDEAGALESPEVREARKRIRKLVRDLENAIAIHEFDKARQIEQEERKERENLSRLREQGEGNAAPRDRITPEDIAEVAAERAGVPVAEVKAVLEQKGTDQAQRIAKELAAHIPIDGNAWVPLLAAYLSRCTVEEAEKLAQAIRAAKAKSESGGAAFGA